MVLSVVAIITGLLLLIWSADCFIDGAATIARYYGMSALLVGVVIIGFGTSAPEIVVSAIAAWQGTPSLALGNAYGSNIANIGLILGFTALLCPIAVHKQVLKKEMPILLAVTALSIWQLSDADISRGDAIVLLIVFALLMGWTIYHGMRHPDAVAQEADVKGDTALSATSHPLIQAWLWTIVGILLLVLASRMMVWGAANIAIYFGIDELVIGLTIFAVGTSLPELASTIAAVRKNQPDLAIGNIIGSNLFNTLAVVGIAGVIHPMAVSPQVLTRDAPVMAAMTIALMLMSIPLGRHGGRINRLEGGLLLLSFIIYTGYLVLSVLSTKT